LACIFHSGKASAGLVPLLMPTRWYLTLTGFLILTEGVHMKKILFALLFPAVCFIGVGCSKEGGTTTKKTEATKKTEEKKTETKTEMKTEEKKTEEKKPEEKKPDDKK